MMNKILVYSLVKTFYEEKGDFVDSFLPIVIMHIPSSPKSITLEKIQEEIYKHTEIRIPLHSINIILSRAKRNELIEKSRSSVSLTENGMHYKVKDEEIRTTERKINELVSSAREFVSKNHNKDFESETIKEALFGLVNKNISIFDMVFSSGANGSIATLGVPSNIDELLIEYVAYIEQNSDAQFRTLVDIVYGSILAAAISSNDIEGLGRDFDRTTVFLDTNIIFNLLNIHHQEQCKPSIELFKLLKINGNFSFRVFDFTIDEIVRVLRGYKNEFSYYSVGAKVDSVYSSMKMKGLRITDVVELIANIEENIVSLGVSIFRTDSAINYYVPPENEVIELCKFKSEQNEHGQKHDLFAISNVRNMRKQRYRKIEDCKVIFLTADNRLAKFNHVYHHSGSNTVNEAIPEKLLTNILWLKTSSKGKRIPVSTLITACKADKLINRKMWRTFFDIVTSLRDAGKVDASALSALFYESSLNEVLDELKTEKKEISQESVLELISDAKEAHDRKTSQILNGKDKVIEVGNAEKFRMVQEKMILEDRFTKREIEIAIRVENGIQEIKDECRKDATKFTNYANYVLTSIAILILIAVVIVTLPHLRVAWPDLEPTIWLLTMATYFVLFLIGVKVDFINNFKKPLLNKINNRIYRILYDRKLPDIQRLESLLSANTDKP